MTNSRVLEGQTEGETTDEFIVGSARAGQGQKGKGLVEMGKWVDGSPLAIPVIVINGHKDGPVLLIDGGTHGDELEGILAVQRICREIDPSSLSGTVIGVPVVNLLAFEGLSRAIPRTLIGDALGTDINRLFPGSADGTTAERIAHAYGEQVIGRADYMITCHGGGASFMVSPKVLFDGVGPTAEQNLELAKAFGWRTLCNTTVYAGTAGDVAASKQVPAIVPELGGSDRLPETHDGHIERVAEGIRNVMRYYNMIDGDDLLDRYDLCDNDHVHAGRDGLLLYEPGFQLEAQVVAGQKIATLFDVYGDQVEELFAQREGVITLIRTYPVVRGGDWICSITTEVARKQA